MKKEYHLNKASQYPAVFEPLANNKPNASAWVAIKDDKLVAVRYVQHFQFDTSKLSNWVMEAKAVYSAIDHPSASVSCIGEHELEAIKEAAVASGYHKNATALDIANIVRSSLIHERKRQFALYRESCMNELRLFGKVATGTFDYSGCIFRPRAHFNRVI